MRIKNIAETVQVILSMVGIALIFAAICWYAIMLSNFGSELLRTAIISIGGVE